MHNIATPATSARKPANRPNVTNNGRSSQIGSTAKQLASQDISAHCSPAVTARASTRTGTRRTVRAPPQLLSKQPGRKDRAFVSHERIKPPPYYRRRRHCCCDRRHRRHCCCCYGRCRRRRRCCCCCRRWAQRSRALTPTCCPLQLAEVHPYGLKARSTPSKWQATKVGRRNLVRAGRRTSGLSGQRSTSDLWSECISTLAKEDSLWIEQHALEALQQDVDRSTKDAPPSTRGLKSARSASRCSRPSKRAGDVGLAPQAAICTPDSESVSRETTGELAGMSAAGVAPAGVAPAASRSQHGNMRV